MMNNILKHDSRQPAGRLLRHFPGLPMNFIILAANIFIVNVLYPLAPLQ